MSEEIPSSIFSEISSCTVCGEKASGRYYNAVVCLPCKSFYIRCTKGGNPTLACQFNQKCSSGKMRLRCQFCRFQKCLSAGMFRKERPDKVKPGQGQMLCLVCGDIANGIHFGISTCEGCKKFYRRAINESNSYSCKHGYHCIISPRTRNDCRYCRFQKCHIVGMSKHAIKMGRPRKKSLHDNDDAVSVTTSRVCKKRPEKNNRQTSKMVSQNRKAEDQDDPLYKGLSINPNDKLSGGLGSAGFLPTISMTDITSESPLGHSSESGPSFSEGVLHVVDQFREPAFQFDMYSESSSGSGIANLEEMQNPRAENTSPFDDDDESDVPDTSPSIMSSFLSDETTSPKEISTPITDTCESLDDTLMLIKSPSNMYYNESYPESLIDNADPITDSTTFPEVTTSFQNLLGNLKTSFPIPDCTLTSSHGKRDLRLLQDTVDPVLNGTRVVKNSEDFNHRALKVDVQLLVKHKGSNVETSREIRASIEERVKRETTLSPVSIDSGEELNASQSSTSLTGYPASSGSLGYRVGLSGVPTSYKDTVVELSTSHPSTSQRGYPASSLANPGYGAGPSEDPTSYKELLNQDVVENTYHNFLNSKTDIFLSECPEGVEEEIQHLVSSVKSEVHHLGLDSSIKKSPRKTIVQDSTSPGHGQSELSKLKRHYDSPYKTPLCMKKIKDQASMREEDSTKPVPRSGDCEKESESGMDLDSQDRRENAGCAEISIRSSPWSTRATQGVDTINTYGTRAFTHLQDKHVTDSNDSQEAKERSQSISADLNDSQEIVEAHPKCQLSSVYSNDTQDIVEPHPECQFKSAYLTQEHEVSYQKEDTQEIVEAHPECQITSANLTQEHKVSYQKDLPRQHADVNGPQPEECPKTDFWLDPQLPSENSLCFMTEELQQILCQATHSYSDLEGQIKQGIENDSQQGDTFERLQYSTENNLRASLGFLLANCPVFLTFDSHDKEHILRNLPQVVMWLVCHKWYNNTSRRGCTQEGEESTSLSRQLMAFDAEMRLVGKAMLTKELDDTEGGLLCLILLLATDYQDFNKTYLINQVREPIIKAFAIYCTAKYGSNDRISDLFAFGPQLRYLGHWHTDIISRRV